MYRLIENSSKVPFLRKYLLYFNYLYFLSNFGFYEEAYIVFEPLVPVIAAYIPREEFTQWFEGNQLEFFVITLRSENSWREFGIRHL